MEDSVIEIGSYGFKDYKKLQNIRISNSLNYIGWSAFYYCENLQ